MKKKKKKKDPIWDESIIVLVLDMKTRETYPQNMKRRRVLDRLCIFTDKNTGRVLKGRIKGIMEDTLDFVFVLEKDSEGANITVDNSKPFMVVFNEAYATVQSGEPVSDKSVQPTVDESVRG